MTSDDARRDGYRAGARLMVGAMGDVEPTAFVQIMADGSGAFVEAVVWVPADRLVPTGSTAAGRSWSKNTQNP